MALSIRFQFLIGRLDTQVKSFDITCTLEFQFLIGRLDTPDAEEVIRVRRYCFNSS